MTSLKCVRLLCHPFPFLQNITFSNLHKKFPLQGKPTMYKYGGKFCLNQVLVAHWRNPGHERNFFFGSQQHHASFSLFSPFLPPSRTCGPRFPPPPPPRHILTRREGRIGGSLVFFFFFPTPNLGLPVSSSSLSLPLSPHHAAKFPLPPNLVSHTCPVFSPAAEDRGGEKILECSGRRRRKLILPTSTLERARYGYKGVGNGSDSLPLTCGEAESCECVSSPIIKDGCPSCGDWAAEGEQGT